jgi:hypothetical protein
MIFPFIKKYKYLIIFNSFSIAIAIVIALFLFFTKNDYNEGFLQNRYSELDPELDAIVEQEFYPCDNFCGPKAECAVTREQCVKDIDCSDCSNATIVREGFSNTNMYDSMETSSLTTDASTFATVIKKDAAIPKMYLGPDLWTKSFNYGLGLSEKKLQYDVKMNPNKYKYVPKYQVTETVTGMFYDIGPTAANAELSYN